MHVVDIYRQGELLVTVKPDESSAQVKRVMGDNNITLTFDDRRNIVFSINDYCTVFGEVYKINKLPVITKLADSYFRYTLLMDAEGFDIAKAQYLFLGDDNSLKETDFSLTESAAGFMDLLMQNIGRISSGWVLGEVLPTQEKTLTFKEQNCYNALGQIAEAFETEFWIEGKRITLAKKSTDTGHTFEQGRFKGLYEITRQNVSDTGVVTKLYAYGSDKNLPEGYRNYSKRLKMPVIDYVEKNTDVYGIAEGVHTFDVYPHRTGTVTSVNAINIFLFSDSTIDFNLNDYMLPGLEPKISFKTGQLAGYTFKVAAFNNDTKEIIILKNAAETALDIPNSQIKPGIGDTYVFVDIAMPQSYVDAAEQELQNKALALLDQISVPQVTYTAEFDPVHIKINNISLNTGDLVWLRDEQLGIERRIRITQVTRGIINEHEYKIELSDVVAVGFRESVINSQAATSRTVTAIGNAFQNNATLNNRIIGTLSFEGIPETNTLSGFKQVVISSADNKLYKLT